MYTDADKEDASVRGKERPMLSKTCQERADAYRAEMLARIAEATEQARKRQRQPRSKT